MDDSGGGNWSLWWLWCSGDLGVVVMVAREGGEELVLVGGVLVLVMLVAGWGGCWWR